MVKDMKDWLVFILILSIFVVIGVIGREFFIGKNLPFLIEQVCDPTTESCYKRDCSGGDCPPNNLSDFKVVAISPSDFSKCSDDSCVAECSQNTIQCKQIICESSSEDHLCSYINAEIE